MKGINSKNDGNLLVFSCESELSHARKLQLSLKTIKSHQTGLLYPSPKTKCSPIKGKGDDGTHLTSLTSTDTIVISRWLVLTNKTGLVNTRGWKWWRRARNKFLRTGALSFNCYKRKTKNWMIHNNFEKITINNHIVSINTFLSITNINLSFLVKFKGS